MCPKIETSRASSTRFERTPPARLIIEPRHSALAWGIWAAMHGTLVLACALAGAPSYVKTLVAAACIASAWRSRPRRQCRCALHAEGWRLAGRADIWEDCVLAGATYTQQWAELVFIANSGRPRRVLIWRDAVPRAAWRALVVLLREGHRRDARHAAAPSKGSELDCGRHGE